MKKFLAITLLISLLALSGCSVNVDFDSDMDDDADTDTTTEATDDDTADDTTANNPADTPAEEESTETAPMAATVTVTMDYEAIAKKLLAEKHGKELSEVEIMMTKTSQNHMRGGVVFAPGGPGSGGLFLATSINGSWEIVHDGNGQIECATMNSYSFPADMIEDCA